MHTFSRGREHLLDDLVRLSRIRFSSTFSCFGLQMRLDLMEEFWDHVSDVLSQMLGYRTAIEICEPLVDADESQFRVDETEAHRSARRGPEVARAAAPAELPNWGMCALPPGRLRQETRRQRREPRAFRVLLPG